MSLYCKIYVNSKMRFDDFTAFVNTQTGGSIHHSNVITTWGEIAINENDEECIFRMYFSSNGFLFFPYYLEIEPSAEIATSIYVSSIATLLECFWRHGIDAIAACSFEDDLPRCGGRTQI